MDISNLKQSLIRFTDMHEGARSLFGYTFAKNGDYNNLRKEAVNILKEIDSNAPEKPINKYIVKESDGHLVEVMADSYCFGYRESSEIVSFYIKDDAVFTSRKFISITLFNEGVS